MTTQASTTLVYTTIDTAIEAMIYHELNSRYKWMIQSGSLVIFSHLARLTFLTKITLAISAACISLNILAILRSANMFAASETRHERSSITVDSSCHRLSMPCPACASVRSLHYHQAISNLLQRGIKALVPSSRLSQASRRLSVLPLLRILARSPTLYHSST